MADSAAMGERDGVLTFRTPVMLRWRDVDALGHLNQSVYHDLLEDARWELFEQLAGDGGVAPFVLARVELDYHAEIRRGSEHEPVELSSSIERVGRSSVTLEHRFVRGDGVTAAQGRSVLVAWDRDARSGRPLTAAERRRLGAEG